MANGGNQVVHFCFKFYGIRILPLRSHLQPSLRSSSFGILSRLLVAPTPLLTYFTIAVAAANDQKKKAFDGAQNGLHAVTRILADMETVAALDSAQEAMAALLGGALPLSDQALPLCSKTLFRLLHLGPLLRTVLFARYRGDRQCSRLCPPLRVLGRTE